MSGPIAERTWPEVEAAASSLLVVPLGATEQHGPHLPLATDTNLALALADALAARRSEVAVAPALPYGSSGEHAAFAGTLSIGAAATALVLVELCRSATATWSRVLLVSAHGGNAAPLRRAVERLRGEGRDVRAWEPRWPGDAHAGATETSLMLALDPGRVDRGRAEAGNVEPIAELLPRLRTAGVRELAPNGVLGDPGGASAAHGRELFAAALDELERTVDRWLGAPAANGAGA